MLYGCKRENSLPDIFLTLRVPSKRVQLREASSEKFSHAKGGWVKVLSVFFCILAIIKGGGHIFSFE